MIESKNNIYGRKIMNVKFYQVIDTVHGSIYYTSLENKIIHTPFFNRLHDVNQCSTVYFTFPPNRTKRYEHSLGTMQLTSDVFYNAVVNSVGSEAVELLMKKMDSEFKKIFEFIKNGRGSSKFIFQFSQRTLSVLDSIKRGLDFIGVKDIINLEFFDVFEGNCLLNLVPRYSKGGYETFLYLCLFQSLRLVGLLHDIGHPPQSHIIEHVLGEIYDELQMLTKEKRTERQNNFVNILSSYRDIDDDSIVQIDNRMAIETKNRKLEHLHEMIGIQIIKYIVDWVFPDLIDNSFSLDNSTFDKINVLYYLTIIEFMFAIIRNKNSFWSGLHSIIDGTIDTDRLDFVPRDSENSGMLWGRVDYKRLINTVKLGVISDKKDEERICVCFSYKNIQLLDSLLTDRYQIFTLINYHHRSVKIASLYQRAVKILAMEYLNQNIEDSNEKLYFSDISGLWRTLEIVYAKDSSVLNLIQWNDSWLNGLLHRHLVEEFGGTSNYNMNLCYNYLREIFLNERRHISLVKRRMEVQEINQIVQDNLSVLIIKIEDEVRSVQNEILKSEIQVKAHEVDNDFIYKLNEKKEACKFLVKILEAFNKMDWGIIQLNLGNDLVPESVEKVMKEYRNEISSYMIERVNFSLGVGSAFIYDQEGHIDQYEKCSDIKERLEGARLGFPYFYIYVHLEGGRDETMLQTLRSKIAKEIARNIAESVESLVNFETK